MLKYQSENVSWTQYEIARRLSFCAATHVIIVCAKFKVTARRFCLLDANALGGRAAM